MGGHCCAVVMAANWDVVSASIGWPSTGGAIWGAVVQRAIWVDVEGAGRWGSVGQAQFEVDRRFSAATSGPSSSP